MRLNHEQLASMKTVIKEALSPIKFGGEIQFKNQPPPQPTPCLIFLSLVFPFQELCGCTFVQYGRKCRGVDPDPANFPERSSSVSGYGSVCVTIYYLT